MLKKYFLKEELVVNKIVRFIQNYLLFALPFVIAFMVWDTIRPENDLANSTAIIQTLRHLLILNMILWFAVLILFLVSLVAIPSIREKTLKRLANIKERDEREQYITGKAARSTYISMLSLMLFLLFFSIFSVNLSRLPENQAPPHHRLNLSIGLGFSLLNKSETEKIPGEKLIFGTKNISLSNSTIILILLCWQLLTFNIAARREQIENS